MGKVINRQGLPCTESKSVELTTTAATFTFGEFPIYGTFLGVMIIKIANAFTAPGTAVPVQFTVDGVSGSTIAVLKADGTPATTADWPGEGIYIAFYDRGADELRLLTGLI